MFKGNPNIRAEGEKITLSENELQEYIKCKEDIIYFAETYFVVVDEQKGEKGVIKLREYQKRILKAFVTPQKGKKSCAVLSSRQVGKSTISTIYITWLALFHKDKLIAIVADKEKTSKNILGRIKVAYSKLPLFIQSGVKLDGWNAKSLALENGSQLIISSTTGTSLTGESISLLYIDEFAKIPPHLIHDFMDSVFPTVDGNPNAKIIIVSCVTKDTYIYTSNGIKQVSDFIQEDKILGYDVPEYEVMGMNKINVGSIMHNNGFVDTLKISSQNGEIECSKNHKLWACRDGIYDWFKAEDLREDDYISIKYGMNIWGNYKNIDFIPPKTNHYQPNYYHVSELTEDFCYFLGLTLSEGYIRKGLNKNGKIISGQITITCGDDISEIFRKLGFKYGCYDGIHYTINSKSLVMTLEYLGFDLSLKAPKKTIPKKLMGISKENMRALLQGIFDGDGCATNGDRGELVCISLSSPEFIKQIRMILNNFGIVSTFSSGITPPTTKSKVYSNFYRLEMTCHSALLYYEHIGFRLPRKIKVIESFKNIEVERGNYTDIIPFSKKIIQKILKENDMVLYSENAFVNYSAEPKDKLHFTRKKLLQIKNKLNDESPKELKNLFENVSHDLKWNKILKIENSKNYTYDFSLNDVKDDFWCHSVLYNGIVGHQTPKGLNHWWDIWKKAINDENDFFPIKINWWEVPGRDAEFKKRIIKNRSLLYWRQEYQAVFLGSSSTLIDPDILENMKIRDPIDYKLGHCLQIYEHPIPKCEYVLGVDTGKGVQRDASVIQVLKITNRFNVEQVAVYWSNTISTTNYSQVVVEVSKYYNDAHILIENNDIGDGVANDIHYNMEWDKIINCDPKGIGVRSTRKSKLEANLNLKRYLEEGWLILHDRKTQEELCKYEEVDGKLNVFCAVSNETDDCVTSLLWACYLFTTKFWEDPNETYEGISGILKKNQIEDNYPEPIIIKTDSMGTYLEEL